MREKLIESLLGWGGLSSYAEDLADWLIANGVAIPVRCKDCKYKDERIHACTNVKFRGERIHIWVEPDDFCSYGERRTNVD